MPRPRRPPGAGPALTFLALLLLPSILVAAQQQHPLEHGARDSTHPAEAQVDNAHRDPPSLGQQPVQPGPVAGAAKRPSYAPLAALDKRAVATKASSAPAITAVRAHPGKNAASGVVIPSARSLHDWEVEDFVLLATVDGHIHARDRYNGEEIWELAGKPMLETIYNVSDGHASLQDQPFLWIVEPREDGALYVLTPGRYPLLQSLGMTVKQLTDIAPYSSDDPDLPVVWNVEKKTFMLLVDAASGVVKQGFTPGRTFSSDDSCAPESRNFFGARERHGRGIIDIGQTVYTITIHNRNTHEHLCTIKYAEWNPNSRDKDLQLQYAETMDKQYIYSRHNGEAIAFDHKRPRRHQRPLFTQPLPYPVARVFDVARPTHDDSAEPPLVLLPQPVGPAYSEDLANHVLLNTTDTGAWYALSEVNYPIVTDGASPASCYMHNDLLDWEPPYFLPDQKSLVGVHILDFKAEAHHSGLRAISAPTYYSNAEGQVISNPPKTSPMEGQKGKQAILDSPSPQTFIESRAFPRYWVASFLTLIIIASLASYKRPAGTEIVSSYLSRWMQPSKVKEPFASLPAATQPDAEPFDEEKQAQQPPSTEVGVPDQLVEETVEESTINASTPQDAKEKKVTFNIPEDDEGDLSPLSRTTTADQASPTEDEAETAATVVNGEAQPVANAVEDGTQDPAAGPGTPKKKKTHRGKRGGRKLNRNQAKDDDEVGRIVDAAKQLEVGPRLHPDEVTMNGDDIQDVSNIKRIGKLTIDQDRLLGNGSGGTFVFEGKWNEREVAVKRMLPQYFGLAEQEVKLLQESDLHPNVIRYFDDEKDENFLYIAVELCQASLFDLYKDGRPGEELTDSQQRLVNDINANARHALYQLANGLNHLHSLRIIHRDIKPQNILIAHPQKNKTGTRLVISDFGLCKTLPDNVSTLIGTTGNAGTVGWKAPELITQPKEITNGSSTGISRDSASSTDPVAQGVKRAVDIFSLGCVFFYVLTNGCHPFDDDEGWMQIREYNIKKEKANLKQLRLGDDSEEPYHLIQWMLKTRPEDRPTAVQVMNHPFFWSDEKRLNFLCDCSDHWEREPRDPPSDYLARLEDYSYDVLDHKRNFLAKLDHSFINSLGKQRKYTGDRMLDLLRALRNKKNHYEDMDEAVKAKVGSLPSGYLRYWTTKFPQLLMSCYECVLDCGLQGESRFRPYFEGQVM
ncbi:hypothetical protein BKA66DRAFT_413028 [Pyrenochaeta sp. MPI-SDFR-AT-0127]|nr:hypothetical protein BKA66DRAFT_413028 [Pyrenochaeta sp. MPI-SDFR-AT-0127]